MPTELLPERYNLYGNSSDFKLNICKKKKWYFDTRWCASFAWEELLAHSTGIFLLIKNFMIPKKNIFASCAFYYIVPIKAEKNNRITLSEKNHTDSLIYLFCFIWWWSWWYYISFIICYIIIDVVLQYLLHCILYLLIYLNRFLESSLLLLLMMISFYLIVCHWFACFWFVEFVLLTMIFYSILLKLGMILPSHVIFFIKELGWYWPGMWSASGTWRVVWNMAGWPLLVDI